MSRSWVIFLLFTSLSAFQGFSQSNLSQSNASLGAEPLNVVPLLIRHSGVVNDASGAPRVGVVSLTFSIYNDEQQAPLWAEVHNVTLTAGGRYNLLLGVHTSGGVPANIFVSGEARWLGVRVDQEPEGVRAMLVSVPYAIKAADAETVAGRKPTDFVLVDALPHAVATELAKKSSLSQSGGFSASTTPQPSTTFADANAGSVLSVQQNGTGYALTATSSGSRGILAQATSATGNAYGIQGSSASNSGIGVWGEASAATGQTFGVVGYAASPNGVGVKSYSANIGIWAEAFNNTGNTIGLVATSYSPSGVAAVIANNAGGAVLSGRSGGVERIGVDGTGNVAITGSLQLKTAGTGIRFSDGTLQTSAAALPRLVTSSDPAGTWQAVQTAPGIVGPLTTTLPPAAVHASATASSNMAAGVLGESLSPAGYGTVGVNSASTGDAVGVAGYSTKSPTGIGVYGEATSTDPAATTSGVFGVTRSSVAGSTGTVGEAMSTSGDTTGVYGAAMSTGGYGVEGDAYATSGVAIGVAGFSDSDQGRGILGNATSLTGQTYGVRGLAQSDSGTGVAAISNSPTGATVGISADVYSPNGTAGVFTNNSGAGDLLVGRSAPGVNVFRVDTAGKGYFSGGTVTGGADFAERFAVRGNTSEYEPGDLLAIDQTSLRRLRRTEEEYSTLVAGVYSTKPGVLAQPYTIDSKQEELEVPLAVVGVVPLKVTAINGAITIGDLLVSSPQPGRAMKGTDRNRMLGAIVGKALQPLAKGEGTILVLVSLQ